MIFNKEFYPTPKSLVEKMVEGIEFSFVSTVLEPSAGDGRLVEGVIVAANRREKPDVDCIEIEPELRSVLKGKGFRVVHDDFMTYYSEKRYDLIVMNPPFSQGAKHLLRAIQMQERDGGGIVCILNAETVRNKCTNERIVLGQKLDEYGAGIEFVERGFSNAEHSSDVTIAIVKITIPVVKRESIIFEKLRKAAEYQEESIEAKELPEKDFMEGIIAQYRMEVDAGIQFLHEYLAMSPLVLDRFVKDDQGTVQQTGKRILNLRIGDKAVFEVDAINRFLQCVREKYWRALFHNPKFTGALTSNLGREYFNRISELKDYEFSRFNIYTVKADLLQKVSIGIDESIITLFDELSGQYAYYPTSKNIHYYNGWKTNKAWIVNQKVIIPLNVWSRFGYLHVNSYDVMQKLSDVEKCFSYLDGCVSFSSVENVLSQAQTEGRTKDLDFRYFKVTFYRKGTCHITFKSEELLKKFNIFGSQRKGWLPQSYGRKEYSEMTPEEQDVIDSFQGKEDYEKVMKNKAFYLMDVNSLPLLGEEVPYED